MEGATPEKEISKWILEKKGMKIHSNQDTQAVGSREGSNEPSRPSDAATFFNKNTAVGFPKSRLNSGFDASENIPKLKSRISGKNYYPNFL